MNFRLPVGDMVFLEWVIVLGSVLTECVGVPISADSIFMGPMIRETSGGEERRGPMLPTLPRKAARYLSPEDFERASKTPVQEPTEEGLKAMQLPNLFEGDIAGIAFNERILYDAESIFRYPQNSALNLVTFPDKLWPKGRIPYTLEEDLSEHERTIIAQAFEEYKDKTCIRFVPKEDYDYDYIHVKKNKDMGCSSYVGRAGGNQTVSLEIDKCFSKGIVAHELMHALGFFHEHSRTDRDKFVKIVDENILPGMLRNFEKYPHKIMDTLDMPYDYNSVMHYHKLAFSRNGKPTIVPYENGAEIGQRYRLSETDASKVKKLYNCQDSLQETTSTSTVSTGSTGSTTVPTTETTSSTASSSTSSSPTFKPYTEDKTDPYSTVTTGATANMLFTTTGSTWTFSTTVGMSQVAPSASSIPATFPQRKKCEDLNDHCKMWSELGHCKWSEKYMAHYCKYSCNACDSLQGLASTPAVSSSFKQGTNPTGGKECNDQNLFCGYWTKIGECERETKFMKIFCKRSCGACHLQEDDGEKMPAVDVVPSRLSTVHTPNGERRYYRFSSNFYRPPA